MLNDILAAGLLALASGAIVYVHHLRVTRIERLRNQFRAHTTQMQRVAENRTLMPRPPYVDLWK